VLEKTNLANHHRNVIQFNKIKIKNQINVHFWKKNIVNHVCHWKYFKNQLKKISFKQISIKYEILKLMFIQCLKLSMG
jgi:hypothetical protein